LPLPNFGQPTHVLVLFENLTLLLQQGLMVLRMARC
jgi:hypothetical protein